MTKLLPIIRTEYWSLKPRLGMVHCNVPRCDRKWRLEGGHQGFTIASAESHAYAHWRKFHKEQGHDGEFRVTCKECITAQEEGKG